MYIHVQYILIIMLSMGSIEIDCLIIENKEVIYNRTIGKLAFGSQDMAVLIINIEICIKVRHVIMRLAVNNIIIFTLFLDDLDPEESTQEVPDLDLSASLFTQNSEEFTLVPEYADLGIIYGLGFEKVCIHLR